MDEEVIRRRNAVFTLIYRNVTSHYSRYVPKAARWLLEVTFLLLALVVLSFWSYVHYMYVVEPEDCLTDIMERPFPYEDILQVEVYSNSTELWLKRQSLLMEMYDSPLDVDTESIVSQNDEKVQNELEIHSESLGWFYWVFNEREKDVQVVKDESVYSVHVHGRDEDKNVSSLPEQHSLYELFDIYTLKLYCIDYTILEFSRQPGYLSLTQSARSHLNISTRRLYISPENATCFGGQFGQFITKYFLGYDMMIIASFKNLLPLVQGSGFVKNLLTGSHYYYRVQWMSKWRYFVGLLPALFFTLVASVLLRQIHYHVFKFLAHFHHLLNEGVPMPIQTGAQVPFLIITYAAIGLVIVMSEALGDDSLFSLLMVATVWEADQFYAVFCKHQVSKIFFPMFFFLYHFIPYAYFVRFNGQFWFIPFMFHWFLLQNAVLFFFHCFEITEQQAQPIEIDVQHQAGQQQRIPFHQQQHQEPQGLHRQDLPVNVHPQAPTSLAEDRDQGRTVTTNDPPQHVDGCGTFAVRQAPSFLSSQQSDSQIPVSTQSNVTPGSPVEETLSEDGRSALFITTLSNISPQLREASGSAVHHSQETLPARLQDVELLACSERDGLHKRKASHETGT